AGLIELDAGQLQLAVGAPTPEVGPIETPLAEQRQRTLCRHREIHRAASLGGLALRLSDDASSLSDLGRRFFCGFAVIHYWRLYNGRDEFKKWLAGAGHYRSAGAPIKKRAGLVRPGPLPGIFRPDRPVSVPRPGGAAASDCRPGKPAAIPAPPFPRRAGEIAGSPARS